MPRKPKAETATENTATPVNNHLKTQDRISREFVKHDFTEDEILERGKRLASAQQDLGTIETTKKAANKNFAAQIDGKKAEIDLLSNEINNKFTNQYVDCKIVMNDPNSGYKSLYRMDNGAFVRKESMSQEELQLDLFDEQLGDQNERLEALENEDKNNL